MTSPVDIEAESLQEKVDSLKAVAEEVDLVGETLDRLGTHMKALAARIGNSELGDITEALQADLTKMMAAFHTIGNAHRAMDSRVTDETVEVERGAAAEGALTPATAQTSAGAAIRTDSNSSRPAASSPSTPKG